MENNPLPPIRIRWSQNHESATATISYLVLRLARLAAIIIFVAAVPVFLVATNVRWIINSPILYSYGFDKYHIPSRTGIDRDELLSAAGQIRDYFNNEEKFLEVSVFHDGVRLRNIYNSREVLHMRDVKGLVGGVYQVQEAIGVYMMAFVVIGLIVWKKRFLRNVARYVALGAGLAVGIVMAIGLLSLGGFDRLFYTFHIVSFSNDLWQLDPRRDYLIAMFPQGFFLDATIWIVAATVVESLFLACLLLVFLRWTPNSGSKRIGNFASRTKGMIET